MRTLGRIYTKQPLRTDNMQSFVNSLRVTRHCCTSLQHFAFYYHIKEFPKVPLCCISSFCLCFSVHLPTYPCSSTICSVPLLFGKPGAVITYIMVRSRSFQWKYQNQWSREMGVTQAHRKEKSEHKPGLPEGWTCVWGCLLGYPRFLPDWHTPSSEVVYATTDHRTATEVRQFLLSVASSLHRDKQPVSSGVRLLLEKNVEELHAAQVWKFDS